MKANSLQEKYWLFKASNKDPEAYSKVYDFYVARIYRFIYFKVNQPEEAKDLTSEVFLKVWQYIVDNKEIRNLNALFYKIARNLIIDHYRKASQKDISLDSEILTDRTELQVDHLDKIEAKLQMDSIESRLLELKNEYREVIVLRFIEGLSIKEIAEILGKKKGAVRVMLYRAINTLKSLMEEKK